MSGVEITNKPWWKRLFCKHDADWYRKPSKFYNLSGDTQIKVCNKCGKVIEERFVRHD